MESYHVVLMNGSERDVRAERVKVIESGAVIFVNANGDAAVIYGPGSWALVEKEARDDRG